MRKKGRDEKKNKIEKKRDENMSAIISNGRQSIPVGETHV